MLLRLESRGLRPAPGEFEPRPCASALCAPDKEDTGPRRSGPRARRRGRRRRRRTARGGLRLPVEAVDGLLPVVRPGEQLQEPLPRRVRYDHPLLRHEERVVRVVAEPPPARRGQPDDPFDGGIDVDVAHPAGDLLSTLDAAGGPASGGADPRAALVARLIEYRRYKAVANELRARAEVQRFVFSRHHLTNGNGNGNGQHSQPSFGERPYLMLNEVSGFDLWAAFQSVLNRAKEASASGEVVRPRFTVGQKIAAIASRLRWAEEGIGFVDLFDENATRAELIVTFLALLELIRLRRARVAQERLFGEIRVYPIASGASAGSRPSATEPND